MTPTEIIASSTALAQIGSDTLVRSVFAIWPIVLYVMIPLGLVLAAIYYFRKKSHRV